MRRDILQRRKDFAAELAARDARGGRRPTRDIVERSIAQSRAPSDEMLLRARASVARRLVREGVVDCELALAYAVWPTDEIRQQEAKVGYGTLTGRAFGRRGNT